MINFIKQLLVRGVWFSFGISALWLANSAFDWVLYPVMMCKGGLYTGGAIMTVLSVPFNLFLIKAYDLLGRDLFALEAAKRSESVPHERRSRWGKLLARSRKLSFIVLSSYDPIPAVLYIREGHAQFNGLTRRDWKLFALATIISNVVWIALIATGLTGAGLIEAELRPVLEFFGISRSLVGACVPLY